MKKKFLILVAFNFLLLTGFAQENLVPNGNFEEKTDCPGAFTDIVSWYSPAIGSPDYMNECQIYNQYHSVPSNVFGYQEALSGVGYVHFSVFQTTYEYREYIQVELTDTLIAEKTYKIKMYASIGDSSKYLVSHIGMYFSNTAFYENYNTALPYEPQFENPVENPLNKTDWTLIQGSYIAQGGEKFITIGNFLEDSKTDTVFVGGVKNYVSVFLEDVSVELDTTVGISEKLKDESEKLRVYPNPANNQITINNSQLTINNQPLIIYNVTGQKVKHLNTNIDVKTIIVDISDLPNGIYIIRINNENHKFNIIH